MNSHAAFGEGNRGHGARPDICVLEGGDRDAALTFAQKLGVRLLDEIPGKDTDTLFLAYDPQGLSLQCGGLVVRAGFDKMKDRIRPGKIRHELLLQAARIRKADGILRAVDATAGFGEDSFLLAAAGFEVQMFEYNPVIAALLRDALHRAGQIPELAKVTRRMTLTECDSVRGLQALKDAVYVIYLDPMFPGRTKSALVGKKFQLLQKLEQPCSSGEELLEAAFLAHPRKLVIKRPLKGGWLGEKKPDYVLSGKAVRYDCFSFPETPERQG